MHDIHEELRDTLPSYEEVLGSDTALRRQINDTIDEYSLRLFNDAHKRLGSVETLIADSLTETSWCGCLHLFSFFATFQSTLQQKTSMLIEVATSEALGLLDDAKSQLQNKAFSLVPSLISVVGRDADGMKYSPAFELVQTKTFPQFKNDLVGLLYYINPFKHVLSTLQNTHLITTVVGFMSFPFLRKFMHDRYIGASCLFATFVILGCNYSSSFESLIRSYAHQMAHRAYIESGWASNHHCNCKPVPESFCGIFHPRYFHPLTPSSHKGVWNGRRGARRRSKLRAFYWDWGSIITEPRWWMFSSGRSSYDFHWPCSGCLLELRCVRAHLSLESQALRLYAWHLNLMLPLEVVCFLLQLLHLLPWLLHPQWKFTFFFDQLAIVLTEGT